MIVMLKDGIIFNTKKVAAILPITYKESGTVGAEIKIDSHLPNGSNYPISVFSSCTTEEIYSAILEAKK